MSQSVIIYTWKLSLVELFFSTAVYPLDTMCIICWYRRCVSKARSFLKSLLLYTYTKLLCVCVCKYNWLCVQAEAQGLGGCVVSSISLCFPSLRQSSSYQSFYFLARLTTRKTPQHWGHKHDMSLCLTCDVGAGLCWSSWLHIFPATA